MIKVNLLPPEHRKADGPPVARLVALVAGAVVTAGAIGCWAWVRMHVLSEATAERVAAEEELAQVKAMADRSAALLNEFKEYEKRRSRIESIGQQRILWSRKLDELADVIHNKGDTKRYLVWLNNVRVAGGRAGESPASLTFAGLSGGDSYAKLSEFHRTIKETREFYEDFLAIDPPVGGKQTFSDNRSPNVGWDFTFNMDHKKPDWREKQ